MKKICIVTDSHCGIGIDEASKLGVRVLPMPLYIDDETYVDGISITRQAFFEKLKSCTSVATSQASPAEVTDLWRECLNEYESLLYMPISSWLSGACNTAKVFAQDDEFAGRVFVVDNGRISTPMHRAILDAVELAQQGMTAGQIKDIIEADGNNMSIYIAVETLDLLKKGGRISGATAAIGTVLDIKPILRVNTGLIEQFDKCRGMKKARRMMIDFIKNDIAEKYDQYADEDIYLMAATSADDETTAKWIEQIKESFPGKEVLCDNLSLGICCHTGEGALGIGVSCRPKIK